MIETEVTVQNSAGFHVRDASLVCKTAMKFNSQLRLHKGGAVADCKSCLDLLSLMAPQGTELVLTAEGDDEQAATNEIVKLFNVKFYEDEFARLAPQRS